MTRLAPPSAWTGRQRPSPFSLWRLYRKLPQALTARVERIGPLARLKGSTVAVRESAVLRVVGALEARGVQVWLAGGWGVDALVGRQTRQHHDVDLVVLAADTAAAVAALDSIGFRCSEERQVPTAWLSSSLVFRDLLGRHVDLHPVVVDGSPGVEGYPAPHIAAECLGTGSLGGRAVGCLTALTQIELHQGYEPRQRDRQDLAVLLGRGSSLP